MKGDGSSELFLMLAVMACVFVFLFFAKPKANGASADGGGADAGHGSDGCGDGGCD